MATATKKVRSAGRVTRPDAVTNGGTKARVAAPMAFVIFEDNSGSYHWKIVGGDGETLALSGRFDSPDEAQKAARHVRDGASSARDASDIERWLDEGGSFSGSTVAKWPARH